MKKLLIILFLGIFLINLVSSLDEGLIQICGGDNELLVGCIGDEELIHLGAEIPATGGGPGGAGAGHTTTPIKPPEEIPPVKPPFIMLASILDLLGIEDIEYKVIGVWFSLISLLILAMYFTLNRKIKKLYFLWKRDKEKEQKIK